MHTSAHTLRSVDACTYVRQAIVKILTTSPGERVMRPDYGAAIHDYVDKQRWLLGCLPNLRRLAVGVDRPAVAGAGETWVVWRSKINWWS